MKNKIIFNISNFFIKNKFRVILFFLFFIFLAVPCLALAQSQDEMFKAEVIEVLQEREFQTEDGSSMLQQNLKLKGLDGKWQDQEIIFEGIHDYQVIKVGTFNVGDHVMVAFNSGPEGEENYYITDYIRYPKLYWLAFIFILLVFFVGRGKGVRALIGLAISFLVIMKIIVPQILAGRNPLWISIMGSVLILLAVIYLTEGIDKKSHLAILSITISLVVVGLIAIIFTNLSKLTGMAQEEIMFLVGLGKNMINFKGLLLAGIIIGTLGVLDDTVVSQIVSVEQIKIANPSLSVKEVYKRGMKIGVSHTSSMINTLFLVYAGASLPLLLLFAVDQPPFLSFNQIINHEMMALEIVRTLAGSIGLILSVPIATLLAGRFLKVEKDKKL